MSKKNQHQTGKVNPITPLDVHDELQGILDFLRAVESIGLNNELQTVTGCDVSTIMSVFSEKLIPLMDQLHPSKVNHTSAEWS